jgi:hypothetical protein
VTVSAAPRKAGPYVGTGTTNTFTFAFKTTSPDLLRVVEADDLGAETDLAYGAGYTVTLNGNQDTSPGGTVTRVAGNLPVDYRLTILSNVPYSQQTDIPSGGVLSEVTVENALDALAIQVQQLAEKTNRAVEIPVTSSVSAEDLLAQLTVGAAAAEQAAIVAADAAAQANAAVAAANEALALINSLATATEATPNTIMLRDANGRSKIAAPNVAGDAANKGYVDGQVGSIATTITHTWTIPGDVKVASGDTDFIIPFFMPTAGTSRSILRARYKINGGTSATCNVQVNGVDVAGLTGLVANTTGGTAAPTGAPVAVAAGALVSMVVTAVSGAPKNLTFSLEMQYKG